MAGEEQPSAHVAHGIFSLPVELPEGETRLDFARPGGNAELSLLAVPLSLTRGLWGTLAVIIGAAVLLLMAKLFSRFFRGDRNNARVIAYVAVVVLLAVAAGLAGLIAAAFVIGLAEAVRWSFPKYLQKRKHTRTATLRNQ